MPKKKLWAGMQMKFSMRMAAVYPAVMSKALTTRWMAIWLKETTHCWMVEGMPIFRISPAVSRWKRNSPFRKRRLG